MNRTLTLLAAGACALVGLALPAQAADMALTRFECGTPQAPTEVNLRFSDTFAFGNLKVQFVFSCYLIKHGANWVLYDTGLGDQPGGFGEASLVEQLPALQVLRQAVRALARLAPGAMKSLRSIPPRLPILRARLPRVVPRCCDPLTSVGERRFLAESAGPQPRLPVPPELQWLSA